MQRRNPVLVAIVTLLWTNLLGGDTARAARGGTGRPNTLLSTIRRVLYGEIPLRLNEDALTNFRLVANAALVRARSPLGGLIASRKMDEAIQKVVPDVASAVTSEPSGKTAQPLHHDLRTDEIFNALDRLRRIRLGKGARASLVGLVRQIAAQIEPQLRKEAIELSVTVQRATKAYRSVKDPWKPTDQERVRLQMHVEGIERNYVKAKHLVAQLSAIRRRVPGFLQHAYEDLSAQVKALKHLFVDFAWTLDPRFGYNAN